MRDHEIGVATRLEAELTCTWNLASSSPRSADDFSDICAEIGQRARCCVLPIVSSGLTFSKNWKERLLTLVKSWTRAFSATRPSASRTNWNKAVLADVDYVKARGGDSGSIQLQVDCMFDLVAQASLNIRF